MQLTLAEVQEIENVLVRGGQSRWSIASDGNGYNVEIITAAWNVPATLRRWLKHGLYGRPDEYRQQVIVFEMPYSADLERKASTWE